MSSLADYHHPQPIRELLESLVQVVCPPLSLELGLQADMIDHLELSMRASPKGVRVALLAGLSGYEVAAMAIPGHLGQRASKLSPKDAVAYFDSWYHSSVMPQHEFAKGIKGLISLSCYEQPAMMEAIGYTPQAWIDKSIQYRLKTYSQAIEEQAKAMVQPDPLPGVTPKGAPHDSP